MNRIGLTHVGDISWPEYVAIFTIEEPEPPGWG